MCRGSGVGWPYDIAGVYDADWRLTYDGAVFDSDSFSVLDSPRPVQWSTDTDWSDDAPREGPFEAVASPMEMEDSPLVTTGLSIPDQILCRASTRRHESGFWITVSSSAVPRVHRCTRVGSAVVPLAVVLCGLVGRGVCHGRGGQPAEGGWPYVIESADYVAVRYVVTSHVDGDDVYRHRSRGVSYQRDCRLVVNSSGAAGGQLYGSNGSVAPSDGSGCSLKHGVVECLTLCVMTFGAYISDCWAFALFSDINMDLLRDAVGSLCVVLFLVYVVAFTKFFAVFQRLISW